ncbi:hypothetical protein EPA93_07845 [Ktedonosporobacter rubrisoli]|uniref:DAGKc domain-containing protein n=1 Tax=Ktedonosporobacter rubrisoli TaxID=2509675 RepID=A0A4P6JL67_KTERU|nr:diacylglycerol kinase family protein [Ktedonosporobacter rubrisoli]QBD75925.1 hypothetical protein EPA93_07845 [Ktedonosporobacter rubrisoli]
MKKALLIHSPGSGKSALLSQTIEGLQAAGIEVVEHIPISALGDGAAGRWAEQELDFVVAAGGDGLIGGLLSHVIGCKLPLGIIPLGTANDVARSVGIPLEIQAAAEAMASSVVREIDIGAAHPGLDEAEPAQGDEKSRKRASLLFAHALTVGINAQFARQATSSSVREQYGALTYPFALKEAVRTYAPIDVELRFHGLVEWSADGSCVTMTEEELSLSCRAAQATVVNAPIFWGPLQATVPGVSLRDRVLDIVVVEDASLQDLMLRLARFFNRQEQRPALPADWHARYPELLAAQRTDIPGIHHVQARGVTIATRGKCQDVTLDGEIACQTPVYARVAAERLRLLVPDPQAVV